MATSVPSYQYRPIDSVSGEIRLLTICSGPFDAPLRLRLDIHRRVRPPSTGAKHSGPRYEALSYTWGSLSDLVDIHLGPCKARLSVTRNLAIALPFLRLPDRDRLIWIDAVCINQANLAERGLQVQLMAEIFQQAATVVCWVGVQSLDSELAIRTIRDLAERVEVDIPRQAVQPVGGAENKEWADMSVPLPYDANTVQVLSEFFARPWFERLWVFQEIRLAGTRAVLQCGGAVIPWQQVMTAGWCLHNKPWKTSISSEFTQRIEMVRQLYNSNPTNLSMLIRRTVHFKCSDQRDRLYALLSLRRNDERKLNVVVDYTQSAGKVYQSYVHQYMSKLRSLRLLCVCELQSYSPDRPTWVPDWSRRQHANAPRAQQYAAGYMPAEIVGITENVLSVIGVHVSTIQTAQPMDTGDGSDEAAITLLRACAPEGVLQQSYPGFDDVSMLEAYCCTMCHDTFSNRIVPERVLFPSFSESQAAVKNILQDSTSPIPVTLPSSRYYRLVIDICAGRSFIRTTDGRMGLAPVIAQPGDHVVTLLGCRSLMLLRPCGEHLKGPSSSSQFRVVGLAYVHGMNNGEALFGPLPSGYRPVLKCDNGVFTEQLFLDRKTGQTTDEDPRFVGFDDDEMATGLFFGAKAPTVEALKARVRPLRTIEMV